LLLYAGFQTLDRTACETQQVAREAPPLGGWRVNTSLYYGFGDHLGSTSVVVDGSGETTGSQLYKAWGASRYNNGTLKTTFKYTGQRDPKGAQSESEAGSISTMPDGA
jgi:uncharacterized protein RhaS with RHS repeats